MEVHLCCANDTLYTILGHNSGPFLCQLTTVRLMSNIKDPMAVVVEEEEEEVAGHQELL